MPTVDHARDRDATSLRGSRDRAIHQRRHSTIVCHHSKITSTNNLPSTRYASIDSMDDHTSDSGTERWMQYAVYKHRTTAHSHTQRERRTTRARGDDLFSWSSPVVYGSAPITTGIRIDPFDRTIVVVID